jgi:hypothetical protein
MMKSEKRKSVRGFVSAVIISILIQAAASATVTVIGSNYRLSSPTIIADVCQSGQGAAVLATKAFIVIRHQNGLTLFCNPVADTDESRGCLLVETLNNLSAYDTAYVYPGDCNMGAIPVSQPDNTSVIFVAGPAYSKVYTYVGDAVTAWRPGNNTYLYGLNLNSAVGITNYQLLWGVTHYQPAFNNAVAENCWFNGNTDCVYVLSPTGNDVACTGTLLNCRLSSRFDAIALCRRNSLIRCINCDIFSDGSTNITHGHARNIFDSSGNMELEDCNIFSPAVSGVDANGIVAAGDVNIVAKRCSFKTSASGSNNANDITVTNNNATITLIDCSGSRANGDITFQGSNILMRPPPKTPVNVTSDKTVILAENGETFDVNSSSMVTVTLPQAGPIYWEYTIRDINYTAGGNVNVKPYSGDAIVKVTGVSLDIDEGYISDSNAYAKIVLKHWPNEPNVVREDANCGQWTEEMP